MQAAVRRLSPGKWLFFTGLMFLFLLCVAFSARGVRAGVPTLVSTQQQASSASSNHHDNGTSPDAVGATYVVTNTNNSGDGSLSAAIAAANSNSGLDTITFNIPGAGVHTITPTGTLAITDPVIIDGYSQPGALANTNFTTQSINSNLLIQLNGQNTSSNADGISISGGGTTIKGLIINRYAGDGIEILNFLVNNNNHIEGNYIGTDSTGTLDLGNAGSGVRIPQECGNVVGGTTPDKRNLISGNNQSGVNLPGSCAGGNTVQGNFIGTNRSGTQGLGNGTGITINGGVSNLIGGTTVGAGNLVSGNNGFGVHLIHSPTGNTVQGNHIGTDAAGTAGIPNGSVGVAFDNGASVNYIGGSAAGAGNLIAFNTGSGVQLFVNGAPPLRNSILSNSIHSNGALGIDLAPSGVTPNDTQDPDAGPNALQNYPVITSAFSSGASTVVTGSLNSITNTQFTLQFFASTTCDASNYGEGQIYLGQTTVATNSTGDTTFTAGLPNGAPFGSYITSTATDPQGNTSEFSMCVQVQSNATATPTSTRTSTSTSTRTSTATSTATSALTSTATQSRTATSTSTPTGGVPTATACAIQFNDVPNGSTFYTYVRCMACRGVISGYGCGAADEPCPGSYFRPGVNVTRGQISKMVALAAELDDPAGTRKFEDVPADSPFYLWIQQLANTGAIGGYPCGGTNPSTGAAEPCNAPANLAYFRPNNNTTRGQLTKIVSEAAGFNEDPGPQQFADVPGDAPFFVWVQRLSNRNVVSGYPCGGTNPATGAAEPCDASSRPYFRVNNNVTRGQTAKIVAETFFPNCQTSEAALSCDTSGNLNGEAVPSAGNVGDVLRFRGRGFTYGEQVLFWFTLPGGEMLGTENSVLDSAIDSSGSFTLGLAISRELLEIGGPGNWSMTFQGADSGNISVIHFCVYP
ncbi:MAG: S-layer homology domain-containing protein [Chloroflexota bacterium]|nr:S-layer homology domain-containing protein [Chloroflexota bacterium]